MRIVFSAAALGMLIAHGPAEAQSCGEAWFQRNQIYKDNGYCFKTARAIRAFGNAGCSYDDVGDVPLSARQRATVADLRAFERSNGCTE